MARYTGGGHTAQGVRDLLRSTEWVAGGIAAAMALVVWSASGWLAVHWLQANQLSTAVVAQALAVMAFVTALRFAEGVYRSAVVGLQQQVLLNVVMSALATVRWVGAIAVLAWVSPTLTAFFAWQAAVSAATILVLSRVTYMHIEAGDRPARFSLAALRGVWRFAAGMFLIALLSFLLTQVDKILLSKILGLREFGQYMLAATVAGGLYMLIMPITQAVYPRLCEQLASGDTAAFARTFHRGAQAMTVAVASTAVVVALFADVLLRLWTRDAGLAEHSARLLALLALGNMLHAFMGVPYHAQLATGWTRLAIGTNLVAIVVIVPGIVWSVPRYGAEGAAWAWLCLAAGYVLISMHVFFARMPHLDKVRWYWNDVALPLLGACFVPVLLRWLAPSPQTSMEQLACLLLASAGAYAGAALCAGEVRHRILLQIARIRTNTSS
ncbi:oligosaccharide flippase family protein [Ramlibacter sp. B156]|uniref:Oligosaccharide flippase family protein n=2 Tax=Ramlibacter montanisoli TaxID=2732512 RepID=A0A849KB45_9BURK|nr:oligosaccharide flippase family protein [Ramlibacter montanisoli]